MNNDLREIRVQYCDNSSLLVINPKGIIRRLYVPIKVQCIDSVDTIKSGIWAYIDEVRSTSKDELIYFINGKEYRHHHFSIQIGF